MLMNTWMGWMMACSLLGGRVAPVVVLWLAWFFQYTTKKRRVKILKTA